MGASGRSNYYLACRVEPELQFSVIERPKPFFYVLVPGGSSSWQTKSLGVVWHTNARKRMQVEWWRWGASLTVGGQQDQEQEKRAWGRRGKGTAPGDTSVLNF